MTPATFELMLTAARTVLANRDAGRVQDPHTVEWAETLIKANPRPINAPSAQQNKESAWPATRAFKPSSTCFALSRRLD